jgi:hypothetical protein
VVGEAATTLGRVLDEVAVDDGGRTALDEETAAVAVLGAVGRELDAGESKPARRGPVAGDAAAVRGAVAGDLSRR